MVRVTDCGSRRYLLRPLEICKTAAQVLRRWFLRFMVLYAEGCSSPVDAAMVQPRFVLGERPATIYLWSSCGLNTTFWWALACLEEAFASGSYYASGEA